jgi:hypothetical protein
MSFPTSRRSFLGAAAAITACAASRPIAAAAPAIGDYRADAALLSRAYRALHPGLHRYATPSAMDARFEALGASLSRPQSLADAYLAFARITAGVRCGHSYPNFYNQSEAIRTSLFEARDKLPFLFRWIGDRMIVTRDGSEAALPPGTRIDAIEQVDAGRLLRSLMPLARADGHNDAKRRQILGLNPSDEFQAFDIYWPMLWPRLVAKGRVHVCATRPDGVSQRIELPLVTLAERRAGIPLIDPMPQGGVLWTLTRHPGGIACLTMPTWSVYNGRWDWRRWLDARLDDIATDGTRGLVIDLRGNEGGLDCGNAILSRLVDRDIAPLEIDRRVRARCVPDDLRPHVDTWDKSFYDWGSRATASRQPGFYDLAAADGDANGGMRITPAGKRFRGKVVVLIDASNSSATFGFVQLLRSSGRATLAGETTGGNRRGINGGAFLFLRLPGSGIEVDIPLIGYFPKAAQPDAGIIPDVPVYVSPADIVKGVDRAMAIATRIASEAG